MSLAFRSFSSSLSLSPSLSSLLFILLLLLSLLIPFLHRAFPHLSPLPSRLSLLSSNQAFSIHSPPSHTFRLGCRELRSGAQTCVFTGLSCINVSSSISGISPHVYLLSTRYQDNQSLSHDSWCSLRHYSSSPRYFGARHWPPPNETIAPRQSCLNAYYRTPQALLRNLSRVRVVPSLWLVNLDYIDNPHNNHLLKDIIWMLDAKLFRQSMSLQENSSFSLFDSEPRVYLPQSATNFSRQTSKDVNRLLYSLVLQLPLEKLYPNVSAEQLQKASEQKRETAQLMTAFPELKNRFLFHGDLQKNEELDLMCTPSLVVGAKIGNGAHPRVCEYMRTKSYELYGIPELEMKFLGQLRYRRPPRRVLILQRHLTRGIQNVADLLHGLKRALPDVEIEILSTKEVSNAEEFVRVFSRAGVLITPHGSQSMGLIWMPRHSSIIEIMPVGYTDHAFNLLAESCNVWHYELQSAIPRGKTKEYYIENCGNKKNHLVDPCSSVKFNEVVVDVNQAIGKTKYALERMGHVVGAWLDTVEKRGWMS